jgi:hypothetical protein
VSVALESCVALEHVIQTALGALSSAHGVGWPAPWREEAAERSPSALNYTAAELADASWITETVDDEEERLRRETQAAIRKMSIKERIRQQRSLEALKQLEELRKRAVAAIDREASERTSARTGTTRIKSGGGRLGQRARMGVAESRVLGKPSGADLLQHAWASHRRNWLNGAWRGLQLVVAVLVGLTAVAQVCVCVCV